MGIHAPQEEENVTDQMFDNLLLKYKNTYDNIIIKNKLQIKQIKGNVICCLVELIIEEVSNLETRPSGV